MKSTLRALALVLVVVAMTGCHTMRFGVEDGHAHNVVKERRNFYFWGLTPELQIDVSRHCPSGAVAVKDEQTFVDGLLSLITLGIYAPRTSEYHCRGNS